MRVGLRLSQGTLEQLDEVVGEAEEDGGKATTPREWVMAQIQALAGQYAKPWRQLEATGKYSVGGDAVFGGDPVLIRLEALEPQHMAPLAGSLEVVIGERTQTRIERSCSIVAAANKALHRDAQQTWQDVNEWVEQLITDKVAEARAKIDVKDIAEEQKEVATRERLEADRARQKQDASPPGDASSPAGG